MKKFKLLSGTFEIGYGIVASDKKYNFYNFLVVADRETKKPCIEFKNQVYFEEDFEIR